MVADPYRLQRPAGCRVKTDASDAAHMSTLLRLDAFSAVTTPDEPTGRPPDQPRPRQTLANPGGLSQRHWLDVDGEPTSVTHVMGSDIGRCATQRLDPNWLFTLEGANGV